MASADYAVAHIFRFTRNPPVAYPPHLAHARHCLPKVQAHRLRPEGTGDQGRYVETRLLLRCLRLRVGHIRRRKRRRSRKPNSSARRQAEAIFLSFNAHHHGGARRPPLPSSRARITVARSCKMTQRPARIPFSMTGRSCTRTTGFATCWNAPRSAAMFGASSMPDTQMMGTDAISGSRS